MLVNCLVGIGFLMGSLIVRPFLPADTSEDSDQDFQSVCKGANTTDEEDNDNLEDVVEIWWGLPSIYWPYIIMGSVVVLTSLAFLPLGLCTSQTTFQMPIYKSKEQNDNSKEVT